MIVQAFSLRIWEADLCEGSLLYIEFQDTQGFRETLSQNKRKTKQAANLTWLHLLEERVKWQCFSHSWLQKLLDWGAMDRLTICNCLEAEVLHTSTLLDVRLAAGLGLFVLFWALHLTRVFPRQVKMSKRKRICWLWNTEISPSFYLRYGNWLDIGCFLKFLGTLRLFTTSSLVLKFILLPQPPKYWKYGSVPPQWLQEESIVWSCICVQSVGGGVWWQE